MQLFNFIFLSRSWTSDRVRLASSLATLGKSAEEEDNPLCLIIYPEGTLVSEMTRPISKKFADRTRIVSFAIALQTSITNSC
jgi:1-acyl-sn-glycerol-3-phosphate acyltransferase